MNMKYLLSIVLALQCTTSMHGAALARLYQQAYKFRAQGMRSWRMPSTVLPNMSVTHPNIALQKAFLNNTGNKFPFPTQIPMVPKSDWSRSIVATGLLGSAIGAGYLWTHDKRVVFAQEEKPVYSEDALRTSQQFLEHLKRNNLLEAQRALSSMTGQLKEKDDYKLLAQRTNQFLIKAEPFLIQEALQQKNENIQNFLKYHICFIVMANGTTKTIKEKEYVLDFPEPHTNLFLALRENSHSKQIFLEAITQMESRIIKSNTTGVLTREDEIFVKVLETMKSLLTDGLQ